MKFLRNHERKVEIEKQLKVTFELELAALQARKALYKSWNEISTYPIHLGNKYQYIIFSVMN
tara:strand:- start:369 stop:554 length:186 start_codon:yes stop_codon:yes gene_type:complete